MFGQGLTGQQRADTTGDYRTYCGGINTSDSTDTTPNTEEAYFSVNTRGFFINFSLYNPSLDAWVAVEMLVEFSSTIIAPAWIVSREFNPNIYETSKEKGLRATEFFRFFLSFYLIIWSIIIQFKLWKKENLKKLLTYRVAFKVWIDLLFFIVVFSNMIVAVVLSNQSTQEILDSEDYIDLIDKSFLYKMIRILEGFILLLVILKVR